MDILQNMENPSYLSFSDCRPLHVYMVHSHGVFHIELNWTDFCTYSCACASIKRHWCKSLYNLPTGAPIILTDKSGDIIHRDSWGTFEAKRLPCLAWYGKNSTGQLLSKINTQKQIIGRQLSNLNVTEAVVRFAQEMGDEQNGGNVAPGSPPVLDPLILQWDFLDHVEGDKYAEMVQGVGSPGLLGGVFEQGLGESLEDGMMSPREVEEGMGIKIGEGGNGSSGGGGFDWRTTATERS